MNTITLIIMPILSVIIGILGAMGIAIWHYKQEKLYRQAVEESKKHLETGLRIVKGVRSNNRNDLNISNMLKNIEKSKIELHIDLRGITDGTPR